MSTFFMIMFLVMVVVGIMMGNSAVEGKLVNADAATVCMNCIFIDSLAILTLSTMYAETDLKLKTKSKIPLTKPVFMTNTVFVNPLMGLLIISELFIIIPVVKKVNVLVVVKLLRLVDQTIQLLTSNASTDPSVTA
jgi:hypothetical protein